MPEEKWLIHDFETGFCSIRGHYYPEMAKIVLLDDIRGLIYRPMGGNSFNEVLYKAYPYPVSHACAVEQEQADLWAKAEELVRQLRQVHCPKCGEPFMGVGVLPSDPVPLCRRCHAPEKENTGEDAETDR